MSAVYLETSALLSWLLGEPRAEEARRVVDSVEQVVTSVLTTLEAERALLRAERTKQLREADARRLRGLMTRAREGWMCMAVHGRVVERAGRPFPVEPLRTLDALHLATALVFTEVFPDLRLLSFDERISENAEALGIGTG